MNQTYTMDSFIQAPEDSEPPGLGRAHWIGGG